MKTYGLQAGGIARRYVFAALIAVELLMSFSFFGYFHVEPISITVAYVPVLLAGALIGPLESAAVGTVFGLASMWKASAHYVMPADQLFSPLFSGAPFGSFVMSVVSRALFGLLVGLLYSGAKRLPRPLLWTALVSYLGRTLHSLCVYTAMAAFFPEQGKGPADAFRGLINPPDIFADLVTAAVVVGVCCLLSGRLWRSFCARLELSRSVQSSAPRRGHGPAVVSVLTLVFAVAVTFYFVHRIDYVLEGNGLELDEEAYADVLHLQVQFLLGIISLMVLVIIFIFLNRQFAAYAAHEGKLDSLTGVMLRRAFFEACSRALRNFSFDDGAPGYFIMIDLDYFKEINDAGGHPEGDRALKEAATRLGDAFGKRSIIGRMGGDEFAVLVYPGASRSELEVALRHFLERMHRTVCGGRALTCSIGALPVTHPAEPQELYLEADRLLYEAKSRGRNCYVIGEIQPASI